MEEEEGDEAAEGKTGLGGGVCGGEDKWKRRRTWRLILACRKRCEDEERKPKRTKENWEIDSRKTKKI